MKAFRRSIMMLGKGSKKWKKIDSNLRINGFQSNMIHMKLKLITICRKKLLMSISYKTQKIFSMSWSPTFAWKLVKSSSSSSCWSWKDRIFLTTASFYEWITSKRWSVKFWSLSIYSLKILSNMMSMGSVKSKSSKNI